ncbi:MAG: hypothetical protein LBV55_04160 [Acholeplasmatales bacterium]|nr:hypothetical protein [Acholeplasmatales bacterium]
MKKIVVVIFKLFLENLSKNDIILQLQSKYPNYADIILSDVNEMYDFLVKENILAD